MESQDKQRFITPGLLRQYKEWLKEQEKSTGTVQAYCRSIQVLKTFLGERSISKTEMIMWKEELTGRYAPASVNAILAGANSFLDYCGWDDSKVKPLKIQKEIFSREERELTKEEYLRLVQTAETTGNRRLSLIIQTICATGIRVSELQFVTAEAVDKGRAVVSCKGKTRTVFIPDKLRCVLSAYIREQKRMEGPVFLTKSGRPLNRSNIWRDMKKLCNGAGVEPEKVFPHNLRHLFARIYYTLEKDLSRLADILGHTSITTTRIYTMESGMVHRRQIERMGLVVT